MLANQVREFSEAEILAAAIIEGQDGFLTVDEKGILDVPDGELPIGFHLCVAMAEKARAFVVQKNVGTEGGGYHRHALSVTSEFPKGFKAEVMRDPIVVRHEGQNVWTDWHQDRPNRVDVWCLSKTGKLGLFQIGVITHDDGSTWRLHGEWRWHGELRQGRIALVGIPSHPKYGSLEGGTSKRTQIFSHPDFQALVKTAKLKKWDGKKPDDLEPPLPAVPAGNRAVVGWSVTFAGQTGMALVHLGCRNAWVHGKDIVDPATPNADGSIQLQRGDIISYEQAVEGWGAKKGSPPKLTGVRLVRRTWE